MKDSFVHLTIVYWAKISKAFVGDRAVEDRKSLQQVNFYLWVSPGIPGSLVKTGWNVLTCHL